MAVLANPFQRQWAEIGADVLGAVEHVGASGWYVLGREVEAFEAELAPRFGARAAVGCASGLDAIEIALKGLGLSPGDKVLTTPMSAFATTLAIVRAGGVPVFVDVDAHGLLDLDLAAAALEADPSIRAMVPVHLFGHALDLSRLEDLTRTHELILVEDCAQAIGARFGEGEAARRVGSVGHAAATSFYPTKNLGALGDGGALVTSDPEAEAVFRSLRDYGQSKKYVHARLGLNSRLDELHAAVLRRAFLPRLDGWTARRGQIAARYAAGLASPLAAALPTPPGSTSVWHLYPLRVQGGHRDRLLEHLRAKDVQAGVHYPKIIPDQPALEGVPFEVFGGLERARALADDELSVPISPHLTDAEIDEVITAVNELTT